MLPVLNENCLDVAIITSPEKRTKKTIEKLKAVAGRVLNKWESKAKTIEQYGMKKKK